MVTVGLMGGQNRELLDYFAILFVVWVHHPDAVGGDEEPGRLSPAAPCADLGGTAFSYVCGPSRRSTPEHRRALRTPEVLPELLNDVALLHVS